MNFWNNFAARHPAAAKWVREGGLFVIVSNLITVFKYLLLQFLPKAFSSLPVVDEDGFVVGFISDGDIMGAVAQHRAHTLFTGGDASMLYFDDMSFEERVDQLKERCVMDYALRKVVCAKPEQSIARVAAMLSKKKFKKLPVVNDEGALVGVVRRTDIVKHIFAKMFA